MLKVSDETVNLIWQREREKMCLFDWQEEKAGDQCKVNCRVNRCIIKNLYAFTRDEGEEGEIVIQ